MSRGHFLTSHPAHETVVHVSLGSRLPETMKYYHLYANPSAVELVVLSGFDTHLTCVNADDGVQEVITKKVV